MALMVVTGCISELAQKLVATLQTTLLSVVSILLILSMPQQQLILQALWFIEMLAAISMQTQFTLLFLAMLQLLAVG